MIQKNRDREAAPGKTNLLNMLPSEAEQTLRDFAVANR